VICDGRLVHLWHQGVLIATLARRHKVADERRAHERKPKTRKTAATPRPTASSAWVTRKVDVSGNVSFAGTRYRAG